MRSLAGVGGLVLWLAFGVEGRPLFREVAAESGLDFVHDPGLSGRFYMPEIMGSGVALLDYDGDDDLDVYMVQGTPSQPNRLFQNRLVEDGRLRFADVTARAGVGHLGIGMGVATGDYDNDGDVDLFVTNVGRDVLYRNTGNGTFSDVTGQAGVDDERWNASAAFVDYDSDGDLDLFVTSYVDFSIRTHKACHDRGGADDYCAPAAYNPLPHRLFRNEGNGTFRDVSGPSGIGSVTGAGLGVTCADVTGDGWIDIYVANDGTPNHLWVNKRDGTFEETGLMSGTAFSAEGAAEAGMGVTATDFDRDGDEDLFVTNLKGETNTLYVNDGSGSFEDATNRFGLGHVSLPFTGFGTEWFDYDNDGWLDLFLANGAVNIVDALRGTPYPYREKNLLLRNDSAKTFVDVSGLAGPALALVDVSRGAAFGDIDNDGDVDLVVSNNNGPARLLLNESAASGRSVSFRLIGTTSNRDGLGARLEVRLKDRTVLWRRAHRDGSYLSASDARVHVGLGSAGVVESVTVHWPGGKRESWAMTSVNRFVTLREGTGVSE
jgi:predicted nucleotidyltransferase